MSYCRGLTKQYNTIMSHFMKNVPRSNPVPRDIIDINNYTSDKYYKSNKVFRKKRNII